MIRILCAGCGVPVEVDIEEVEALCDRCGEQLIETKCSFGGDEDDTTETRSTN